ncbi:hypothetical protein SLS62_005142 [Diatrype stigma]|uniref:ABC transporter TMD0 domain-containing protein n=1 Tax=Diatrype stigma TaxID=117547 RepID=A0AAN9UV90_9PEZI
MDLTSGHSTLLQLNGKDFDFTIQFEQLFFSIIPSVLFIVTSLWRTASQVRKPAVVNAPLFQLIKLGAIISYVGLELSLLVLAAIGSFHVTSFSITASALNLVAALFMITLSFVDHSRSPRPSVLLNGYLFLTLLLDIAQARTLFLLSDDKSGRTYSSIFCASIAVKVGILLLEAKQKSKWVPWDEKQHSPEETSNIFSLGVFFWLNKMFLDGYKKDLVVEDLYPLDISLDSKSLHDKFSKNMDYSKLRGDKYGLLKVLIKTLSGPLLLPILPRLALLDMLRYLHHRMRAMTRSILVTETFIKATEARIGASDHSAALTLMSTDIERIKQGLRMVHDVWAGIIQAALAGWMLHSRLGVVFVAPIGMVIVCFTCLGVLINFTGDSQRSWMTGVQKRVGLTAAVIASMKNLKLSGLSCTVGDFVQKLRVEELAAGARFRKIFILAALYGFTPMLIN